MSDNDTPKTGSVPFDLVIIGSGPAGLSAAARAKLLGVRFVLLEANRERHLDTLYNYHKGKHVMAEPGFLPVRSDLSFAACSREELLDSWNKELANWDIKIDYGKRVNAISRDERSGVFIVRSEDGSAYSSKAVILAIGQQGNIGKLDIPGANHPRVQYSLADPDEFSSETIIVVGAGDSAIENALGLAKQNKVHLLNRDDGYIYCNDANRDLIRAAEKDGKVIVHHSTTIIEIEDSVATDKGNAALSVRCRNKDGEQTIPGHRVIARLGANPARELIESFGVTFSSTSPAAVPTLSDTYESNVPNLYVIGSLSGCPLIKHALNQGYEAVQSIVGKPVESADEQLLQEKFQVWKPGATSSTLIDSIRETLCLFSSLTRLQLREFMLASKLLAPAAGSIIFNKYDFTNTFFSVLEGEVEVEIKGLDDQPLIITLGKGRYFGEMGLITGHRRIATVRAGQNCILLETPRSIILKLIACSKDIDKQIDRLFIRNVVFNHFAPTLESEKVDKIIAEGVEIRRYAPDEILFKEGDKADGLYLIRRGSVAVSILDQGQEQIQAYVSAGSYIGEMALLNNEPRSATVRAKVMTEALFLNGALIQQQLAENPLWRRAINENALKRLEANLFTCHDIVIVGSGPAGLSAAARAKVLGIRHVLLEADHAHIADTVFKYQKGKHVMAEPGILPLRSEISFAPGKREVVLEAWNDGVNKLDVNIKYGKRVNYISRDEHIGLFTIRSEDGSEYLGKAVILAIGLQGNIRKTGTPGQDHPLVQYTLADPDEFVGETIIVIGAGDAGIENALALASQNTVYLMNRGEEIVLCKDANRALINAAEKAGKVKVYHSATTVKIEDRDGAAEDGGPPLNYVFNGKEGETVIPCHRVIARLGATPPRKLIESFGIRFPNESPTSVPVLSESYESNVPNLYIVGALGGYPLIKQAMNQGYDVVQHIIGKLISYEDFELVQSVHGAAIEPVDEPLLREKFRAWQPGMPVSDVIELIMKTVQLFRSMSKLQVRDFLLESTLLKPATGSIIFKKLDYTNTFFSILEGEVEVDITGEDGKPKTVTLEKGKYFGEMGLISGRRRTATIRAGKNCVLLETPRRSMLKLIGAVDDVRKQIDDVFIRNAISNFIGPMLKPEVIDELIAGGVEMRRYNTNEVLFKEGDAADGLYLIRRGSVAVSNLVIDNKKRILSTDSNQRILSYVSAGNYVGEMALLSNEPRSATVTATVLTEVLVLDGESVRAQLAAYPLLRKSITELALKRKHSNVLLEQSTSRESDLMRFLLGQGIGEASDVLLIDESLCIQCNNCETACAETHEGTSRLIREAGPTFANIHLPTACRHCENPTCMRDCPPDAISRSEQGEVFISDACIGCGNCERNCPYGVIQMAVQKPPKPGGGLIWTLFGLGAAPGQRQPDYDPNALKKAVKCDLCKGREGGPACVRACPTGAAIRVSPERYFKNIKG